MLSNVLILQALNFFNHDGILYTKPVKTVLTAVKSC